LIEERLDRGQELIEGKDGKRKIMEREEVWKDENEE